MALLLTIILCIVSISTPVAASEGIPPMERTTLSNGMVLLVSEEHSLPFVTVQVLINAGARTDPPGEEGLSHLTARGLLLGTRTKTAAQISEALDFMGASLDTMTTRDYITVTLRVLRKDLDKGMALLADVITAPLFPADEVKREIERTIAGIRSEEDDPGEVAEKEFIKVLFVDNPYGHPVEGTRESVARLTAESIARFHKDWLHPNNAIMIVAGDITPQEVQTRLLPQLGKWEAGKLPSVTFHGSFAGTQKTVKLDKPITQANIILGNSGVSRDNPDFYAITVMNYILGGGGFASRLTDAIRVKRGLAYSVHSFFDYGKYPGSFQVVLQTKNRSAGESIALALKEMERLQREPVSDKELESAKKYLIGTFPMRLTTQSKLVNFFGQVEYYGLGLDYPKRYPSLINRVTREDILRVARTYLHPDKYVLVVVADLKEAGMDSP